MKVRIEPKALKAIENHVVQNHRCIFFVFGDEAKVKIPLLLHLTRRCTSNNNVMNLLWFQEKENNCTRKLERKWQKKLKHSLKKEDFKHEDHLEMMIVSSNVTYCGPGNCHRVLGHTYDACIFENFKALNPNILARCIETVRGGGSIIFLLEAFTCFEQLYQLEMNIHKKYKTDWYPEVRPRFNKRFVASLKSCPSAFSVSSNFSIYPLSETIPVDMLTSNHNKNMLCSVRNKLSHLEEIKPYAKLLEQCVTDGQFVVVLEVIRLVRSCNDEQSVVSLTSGRGRGKSASLGLGLAAAISNGISNIAVTSPGVENIQTLLQFACMGLNALGYKENVDYFIGKSPMETGSLLMKIEIRKHQRQTIEYKQPFEVDTLIRSDLLCIDEAAAIPLNVTKKLLKARCCIISSTIQGYEGTGRSLSLKLLEDIRRRSKLNIPLNLNDSPKTIVEVIKTSNSKTSGASMTELTLTHCIRYSDSDPVELWLDQLFCLSTSESIPTFTTPSLDDCHLYQVDMDALFSGSPTSERFLSSIVAVYVASHYKNSPNDLVMMADAPAHKLFCLLSQHDRSSPQVICVIQVAMEGNVKLESLKKFWEGDERPSGDLMSWILEQQFPGQEFALRKGMRVVRIATHSYFQKMGFGRRAMDLLIKHCEKGSLVPSPSKQVPTKVIFKCLEDADILADVEHIGACFGGSLSLIRFWKSLKMQPVYISQVSNEVTGEHSCIFLRDLKKPITDKLCVQNMWLDFRLRFLRLLPHSFRFWDSNSALEVLVCDQMKGNENYGTSFSKLDKERLKNYLMDKLEMRAVFDLLHDISEQLFLSGNLCNFSRDKMVVMLAVGVQGKSFSEVALELNDANQQKNRGKNTEFNSTSVSRLLNQTFKSFIEKRLRSSQDKISERASKKKKMSEE